MINDPINTLQVPLAATSSLAHPTGQKAKNQITTSLSRTWRQNLTLLFMISSFTAVVAMMVEALTSEDDLATIRRRQKRLTPMIDDSIKRANNSTMSEH